MIQDSKTAETAAILATAQKMCAAARTAPKACGKDTIHTCIMTGETLHQIADEMERLGKEHEVLFFSRDAQNLRNSTALVVIGCEIVPRMLTYCQYCHFENCKECKKNDGICVYAPMDLGIALGSAVGVAADERIDNRIFYTAGKAVLSLGLLPPEVRIAMGIPLSAWGKSIYHDQRELMKK
ncbi:MAG: ferredoxin domain-containing protein [Christensenellales bacterium]